jgi:SPP1 family predicted phage head-tail adaptor
MALKKKLPNGAGKRNNYVTVQVATDAAPNASGEVLPVWSTLCSRWAETVFSSGREFLAAMQVTPLLQGVIKLPYDALTKTITARHRIVDDGRIFNIAACWNENEDNEKMVLWLVGPD